MKRASSVFSSYGTTIFEVMSRLARDTGAVNLGQGFPDGNGPEDLRRAAARALEDRPNQYPPSLGVAELRDAIAVHGRRFYGLDLDPQTQVLVTSGATEALASSFLGLLDPGDEAVVFEPAYDSYVPVIRSVGAIAVPVRLEPPHWRIDADALRAAFGARTKLVVVNSPMNPAGKVFDRAELELIAELCREHDAYAVCDEVYEHIVFDDAEHVPLMTLPGMAARTARIGSAGKTFSLTGWKVGYVSAGAEMLSSIARAHQYLTFTTPPNLQRAVAVGLGKDDDYFRELATDFARRRDVLAAGLRDVGFGVGSAQGTYFLAADYAPLGFDGDDVAFCKHITERAGVAAIPFSPFYMAGLDSTFVRFCFCKDDATLEEALTRLRTHFAR